MEEKLNFAYGKLDELLEVHKDYPMTTNSHFINNSQRPRQDKNKGHFEDAMNKTLLKSGQKVGIEEISRLLSTMNSQSHLDMDMVAAEEALDNMNAYYEVLSSSPVHPSDESDTLQVAMNLFTDNVPTLAVQAPIIRQVPTIFSPTTVFSMAEDLIKRIAAETEEKVEERVAILRDLEVLEKGARICKLYAKRSQACKNSRRPY